MAAKEEVKAPNIGSMLRTYYKKHKINRAALARKLNLHRVTVAKYDARSSLQVHILWDVAVALQHNFFADLAAQLPKSYTTYVPEDTTQAQRIAQLEDENKILAGQLELLKGVMGKG